MTILSLSTLNQNICQLAFPLLNSLLVRLHSYTEKDQYYCQMDRYASDSG